MDKFFEKVSLGTLLRWVIAGAMCFVAFLATRYGWSFVENWSLASDHYLLLIAFVVIVGALLYGVYRSVIYPQLFRIVNHLADPKRSRMYFVDMIVFWDMNRSNDNLGLQKNRHSRITAWGDIAHSQVTGALGVLVGMVADNLFDPGAKNSFDCLLVILSIILLLSGILSLLRLLSYQKFIAEICPEKAAVSIAMIQDIASTKYP